MALSLSLVEGRENATGVGGVGGSVNWLDDFDWGEYYKTSREGLVGINGGAKIGVKMVCGYYVRGMDWLSFKQFRLISDGFDSGWMGWQSSRLIDRVENLEK
jgi:hypothetical protein